MHDRSLISEIVANNSSIHISFINIDITIIISAVLLLDWDALFEIVFYWSCGAGIEVVSSAEVAEVVKESDGSLTMHLKNGNVMSYLQHTYIHTYIHTL